MKVLITGANGMVARAAAEHSRSIGDEVVAITREQTDIADKGAVRKLIGDHRPDAVLNCAAYTNVDGAETDSETSEAANSTGVRNLAAACREFNSGFLTISTDYIFDGTNTGFYTQRDTANPGGVYAKTKYEGETAAREIYARTITVRSGWIYGKGGTNFLSVMHRLLAEGKPIKAISDSYGTPTFAGDLVKRMRELIELDLPCIYHVTNSGPGTSYYGFAEKVSELGGFDRSLITAVSEAELTRPAPRPRSSKLACLFSERFGLEPLPKWDDALAEFLDSEK